MGSRPAQQSLTPGRVVLLANAATGTTELAVVLGIAAAGTAAALERKSVEREYYFLVLHRPNPLDPPDATKPTTKADDLGDLPQGEALFHLGSDREGALLYHLLNV